MNFADFASLIKYRSVFFLGLLTNQLIYASLKLPYLLQAAQFYQVQNSWLTIQEAYINFIKLIHRSE